jgi:hypothetical protein
LINYVAIPTRHTEKVEEKSSHEDRNKQDYTPGVSKARIPLIILPFTNLSLIPSLGYSLSNASLSFEFEVILLLHDLVILSSLTSL